MAPVQHMLPSWTAVAVCVGASLPNPTHTHAPTYPPHNSTPAHPPLLAAVDRWMDFTFHPTNYPLKEMQVGLGGQWFVAPRARIRNPIRMCGGPGTGAGRHLNWTSPHVLCTHPPAHTPTKK